MLNDTKVYSKSTMNIKGLESLRAVGQIKEHGSSWEEGPGRDFHIFV